jgi:phenylalanyl-tRNA synthetase beta chain
MKISLKWISEYFESDNALATIFSHLTELREKLPLSGLEIGYREAKHAEISGVVTAKIMSHRRHPNADRLNICQVKVSDTENYEIVCGAPNVRDGMIVALARENVVLPGNFKIQKTKIRGIESCGMLCSEKELALSENSQGIMDLPNDTALNQALVDVLDLRDEVWQRLLLSAVM